jgi:hypothetical protein
MFPELIIAMRRELIGVFERKDYGLPAGPAALGHPTNEDLFVGTPVRAVTS